jgi:uncharacterized protein DUF4956
MSSAVTAQITFSDERFWAGLGIDLVAIVVLAYVVYFRRHRRRDLLMAYVCFNVALFAVVTALTSVPASGNGATGGLALGLGLLGALSIIRLRSEELSFAEVAYFFSSLALAVANGVGLGNAAHSAVVSTVVVGAMYAMDHLEPHRKMERMTVDLDEIHSDDVSLRAELERRLGTEVVAVSIKQIDYVRETMRLGVDYRPRGTRERSLQDSPQMVAPSS